MLDEKEFLSPGGIRSISKIHEHGYSVNIDGQDFGLELSTWLKETRHLFGGNSNWRGPVWMPMNYLLVHGAADNIVIIIKKIAKLNFQPVQAIR